MIYSRPNCFDCKHYDPELGTCKAFPKEIPEEIYLNRKKHTKPLKRQENEIVFEPIK